MEKRDALHFETVALQCFEGSRWHSSSLASMSLGDPAFRVGLPPAWWTTMQWEQEVAFRGFSGGDIGRGSQSQTALTLQKEQFKKSCVHSEGLPEITE